MRFEIRAFNPITQREQLFLYDNESSELLHADGSLAVSTMLRAWPEANAISIDNPGRKVAGVKFLKISLGLSCNYECNYCSQRYVPRAEETNKDHVEGFLEKVSVLDAPDKVQFWGGEPFVYWKTLKPLAEALRARWPKAQFGIITNGSLLDIGKNAWLDELGFSVSISHDGPGYHIRGQDPLDDPAKAAAIHDLYRRLHPQRRISINAMIHRDNPSRAAVQEWLQERFGYDVPIGEGGFIDAYDEGGLGSVFTSAAEHIRFRQQALEEIRAGKIANFQVLRQRLEDFTQSVIRGRPASTLGQKCGMDAENQMAVNLRGEISTCQNVSATSTAANGQSHKLGTLDDIEAVEVKTSTHWKHRPDCRSCPVLQLCKGSCMYLAGAHWEASCDASFSDHIPFFAYAFEILTGCVPVYIDGPQRADRKDIFGAIYGIPEAAPRRRTIPIALAA